MDVIMEDNLCLMLIDAIKQQQQQQLKHEDNQSIALN